MIDEQQGVSRSWDEACNYIKSESLFAYGNFFRNIVPLEQNGDALLLGISDEFAAQWIMDNYSGILMEALEKAFGKKLQIEWEYGHQPQTEPRGEDNASFAEPAAEPVPEPAAFLSAPVPAERKIAENCLPGHTFDSFVVGEENRYAFTAAMTAAQTPGKWNPLYIYGGSGMGKTHLIQAVANDMVSRNPNTVVRYITCEEFLNEYVASLRSRTDFKFRDRFRNVDLLLVDDVHFLSGNKVQLQEEFFNTFNTLYNKGRQIILTSDKQPSEIPGLEKRLVSRFQSGVATQITSSTFETRLAILRQAQENISPEFSDQVLSFLASRITSNIRPLKSALLRLSVFSNAGEGEITVQKAEQLLSDLLDREAEEKSFRISIEAIQKAVAAHFGIQIRDLTGVKRPKNIAEPRMIAMYLCRQMTDCSQQDIGAAFGGRTHATVIHAIRQVDTMCQKNESVKQTISVLRRQLQSL